MNFEKRVVTTESHAGLVLGLINALVTLDENECAAKDAVAFSAILKQTRRLAQELNDHVTKECAVTPWSIIR